MQSTRVEGARDLVGNLVSNLRAGTYGAPGRRLRRGGQEATPIEGEGSRAERRVETAEATSGRGRRGAPARSERGRDMREARLADRDPGCWVGVYRRGPDCRRDRDSVGWSCN